MDPLFNAMEKAEAAIGHSPHPAIVAVPLGSWTVSVISDGLGLLTGNRIYDDVARISMAIGLVGAAGAIVTGLHDYSYIPLQRSPSHGIATTHALGNAVTSALFVTSYVLRTRRHLARPPRRPGVLARVLALAGGCLSMYTAWLGGKLVEEQGEAVKPVIRRQAMEAKSA